MTATKHSALVASVCGLSALTVWAGTGTPEGGRATADGDATVWTLPAPRARESPPPDDRFGCAGTTIDGPLTEGTTGRHGGWSRAGNVGFGLVQVGPSSPSQTLRQATSPRAPSTLRAGQREVRWSETLANIWNQDSDEYRVDFGTLTSTLGVAYGVSDEVLFELRFTDVTRLDSVLDPLTAAFHDVFGIEGGHRSEFPEADNHFEVLLADGSLIEDEDSGSMTRDLALTIQHTPTLGGEWLPALSYWGSVAYDAGGKNRVTGERWSWVVGAAASKRLGSRWVLYGSASQGWFGPDEFRGVAPGAFDLEDTQSQWAVGVEYQRGVSSWIVEYLQSDGWATEVEPFSESAHELALAWRRELASGALFELGLIENVIEFDNSADFGLHFSFRHRF